MVVSGKASMINTKSLLLTRERLGLASDGFNPFGHQSATYSMWPVLVIPYNMPANVYTKESNYMMALLILGPKSPGKDFDLFMEPLVEELQQLWKGVLT